MVKIIKGIYLDCDGVMINTPEYCDNILLSKYGTLDISNEEIKEFYANLDWNKVLKEVEDIPGSFEATLQMVRLGYVSKILTHVHTEGEALKKNASFNKRLPGVEVITVPKSIDKADYVSPVGNILVDDYLKNLISWQDKGGIGIKFSDKENDNLYSEVLVKGVSYRFFRVTSLWQVIDIIEKFNRDNSCLVKKRKR